MAIHAQNTITLNTIPAYTSLLGGHFRFGSGQGANVVENSVENPNNWGFNTHIGANGIQLRHNTVKLSEWSLLGLKFYSPIVSEGTVVDSQLCMELTNEFLKFYNPTTHNTDAIIDSNGLTLSKGGINAGEIESNKFIYLSTEDYPLQKYKKTTDEEIVEDKDYYIFDDNTFIIVSDPIPSELSSYYEVDVQGIDINGHLPTYINEQKRDAGWRQIIGQNFGIDGNGILYASGANISGQLTITGTGSNVYSKNEVDITIDEAINDIENKTIYAYSNNSDGHMYDYNSSHLKYRGIFVTNHQNEEGIIVPPESHYEKTQDVEIDTTKTYYKLEGTFYVVVQNPIESEISDYYELIEQPEKFQWEVNPVYAEQNASKYIATITGGIKIGSADAINQAYLSITNILLQFWLYNKPMAFFGYNKLYESYGVTAENVMITGAGNALRLDNGVNGTYQGQYILETRANGHLSLKPGLSRGEEE